nr:YolD-like family protein [Anaerosporobacter faecicola]
MSPAERAKQFMPFDALKGFREALREKEKIIVPKVELSDYAKSILDEKLHQVQKNDMITVIYFEQGVYLKVTGLVSRLDTTSRTIKIVNTKISFDDIYDIQGRIQWLE